MSSRYNLSRNYYNIVKADHWPSYDEFLNLDLNSEEIIKLGNDVIDEIQGYIDQEPKYHPSLLPFFKFKFPGIENITEHFSQSWQDLFVLSMLEGKKNGTYLEIGAGWPILNSNTYLLTLLGYTGLSIDIDMFQMSEEWKKYRPESIFVKDNALNIDYTCLLSDHNFPRVIDYLQIDIDPDIANLEVLYKIPFDTYQFSVITFETDVYRGNKEIQIESQNYLKSLGYSLLLENVAVKNWDSNSWEPFEDWYIHPDMICQSNKEKFQKNNYHKILPHDIFINQELT